MLFEHPGDQPQAANKENFAKSRRASADYQANLNRRGNTVLRCRKAAMPSKRLPALLDAPVRWMPARSRENPRSVPFRLSSLFFTEDLVGLTVLLFHGPPAAPLARPENSAVEDTATQCRATSPLARRAIIKQTFTRTPCHAGEREPLKIIERACPLAPLMSHADHEHVSHVETIIEFFEATPGPYQDKLGFL